MRNPNQLEEAFQDFIDHFPERMPDGVVSVDIGLLNQLGLLNHGSLEDTSDNIMHYFHVVELPDKVTLYNDTFAVWIVPQVESDHPTTLTFIALLNKKKPQFEIVFSTDGVYNTPRYILRVLQHYLTEVIDTEESLSAIDPEGH